MVKSVKVLKIRMKDFEDTFRMIVFRTTNFDYLKVRKKGKVSGTNFAGLFPKRVFREW